jgi:hypothetical protein
VKPAIAFVSARAARGLDEDVPPFEAALRAAGARMEVVDWDDPTVEWESFDLVLLRSTWDYTERLREFLVWVDTTARRTTVLNPPSVVRWNTDKHYLGELARAAVPIPVVPSTFVEPGESAERALDSFLARHDCPEFVVKPSVGANSRDTERHARTRVEPALAQARRLLDAERSVLLQPYLDSVDRDGETALIYFAGKFSHAIRKAPLLPGVAGSPAVGLFGQERITARVPGADELRVGEEVLAGLPFDTPLYARIDLIRDAGGAPTLLELELTEPSLFLVHAPGAAERFSAAVLEVARSL